MMHFRKSNFLLPALSLVLALYYTLPFLLKITYWGVRDWDLFTTITAAPVGSIVYYGQFPFWNPYLAGGNILFHHPEVAILTPFFLLQLLFGSVIGLKLQVLVCYFLGFWGSQRLFRTLGMSVGAAVVASVAYFGSVHFALHFAEGHLPFTHYAFLPWFGHCVIEAAKDRRYLYGAVAALALMILGNGAAVPLVYTLLFTGLLIGLRALDSRRLKELGMLAAATGLALLVAAVKFLPMVVYLMQNSWAGNPDEAIPVSALGPIFFGWTHSLFAQNFPGQQWAWHEYGAYLSPLLVVLAVVALVRMFRTRWLWLVLAAFFLLLGLGDFGPLSPWALLTGLPGFSSLRATGRAFQFVILSFAILGGLGLDDIRVWAAGQKRAGLLRAGVLVAAGVIVATNMIFAWPIMSSAFRQPPKQVDRSPVFRQVIDESPRAFENYCGNRGSLVSPWLSAYHPSRALVGPGDVVYAEYVLSGKAVVNNRDYTPNEITYDITGESAGQMVIGMGYDDGWEAEDGRQLTPVQDLIAFQFVSGPQTIILRYRTPFFYIGLSISMLSLIGLGAVRRRLTAPEAHAVGRDRS